MGRIEGAYGHVGHGGLHKLPTFRPGFLALGRIGVDQRNVYIGISIVGAAAERAIEETHPHSRIGLHVTLQSTDETLLLKHGSLSGDEATKCAHQQDGREAQGDARQHLRRRMALQIKADRGDQHQ